MNEVKKAQLKQLSAMEQLLDPDSRWLLKRIYAPQAVAVPPEDSRRSICVMPDGEIRVYGQMDKPHPHQNGTWVYLRSRDCGLSWSLCRKRENCIDSSFRSPYSGRYLVVREGYNGFPGKSYSEKSGLYDLSGTAPENQGTFVYCSEKGPDYEDCVRHRITDKTFGDFFLPKALKAIKRLIVTASWKDKQLNYHPVVLYSDDDGDTWQVNILPSTEKHQKAYPHRMVRWQNNGAEPVLTELKDGTILLLARTSLDVFYAYYSYDHGTTFTEGTPTNFHGTLTTPSFLELHDGRIILFWCNTQPLPEIPVSEMLPDFDGEERRILEEGLSEDVFTNRDAVHAAITEDGIHWTGFRELYLNPLRNQPDFRTSGDFTSSLDKSVHQSQAIELPLGKVLVSVGQHEAVRKLLIFDIDWLYEKTRFEDFGSGLSNVTTHVYVKSYSGCALCENLSGHCQYNRTNGALLVPFGPRRFKESLLICRTSDPRLLSNKQGVVWNFPSCGHGICKVLIQIKGAGVRVSLTDRWFNATDETIRDDAAYTFCLQQADIDRDCFSLLSIHYGAEKASVFCNERKLFDLNRRNPLPNGLSYLHIMTLAEAPDYEGTLIASMENCSD